MGKFGGLALRGTQMFLYFIAFCCSAIILGFYSYFLSVQADRSGSIPRWEKAVEGISGAAVLYTIAATVLTCCIGGVSFFAFLGIVLDVLFAAAFIAVAVLTRDGAHSCTGSNVRSPLGSGPDDQGSNGFDSDNVTYAVTNGTACRFNKASFSVAIIGAFVFLIAAVFQLFLGKHHKKEKRFGPSPSNGYTHGSSGNRRFWQRKRKGTAAGAVGGAAAGSALHKDVEAGHGGLTADHYVDTRPSHDTAFTGSTVTAPGAAMHGTAVGNKYDPTVTSGHGTHGALGTHGTHGTHGYHTAPTGTAVNPYGYENTHPTTSTNY